MNVYAFYEPINEYSDIHQDQKKLIELWKKSWSYYGWNPIVYGIDECKSSKDYIDVYETCKQLPTENQKTYELYCFLRWIHMSEIGGWYADLDMINYGFFPIESSDKIISTSPALHCSCIYMPKERYKEIIDSFKALNDYDPRHGIVNNKKHYSDMFIFESYSNNVDTKLDIQKEYMQDGYQTAKVVHYHFGIFNNPYTSGKTRTQIILEDPRTKLFI